MRKYGIFMFFLLSLSFVLKGQKLASEANIDSLLGQGIRLLDSYPDSSFRFVEKALKLAEEKEYSYGIARGNELLGYLLEEDKEFNEALIHYLNAIEEAKSLVDFKKKVFTLAATLNNAALIFKRFKAYDLAIEFHNNALSVAMENELMEIVPNIRSNLAVVKELQGKFKESLNIKRQTIKHFSPGSEMYMKELYGMSQCYLGLSLFDSSIYLSRKQMIEFPVNYYPGVPFILARSFWKKQNPDSAIFYFNLAIEEHHKSKPSIRDPGLVRTLHFYARFHIERAEYRKAEALLLQASEVSNTMNPDLKDEEYFFDIYNLLFELNERFGNREGAIHYKNLYREELNQYTELHRKYDMERIVNDYYAGLAEQEREKTVRLYATLISGGFLLVLGATIGFGSYQRRRTKKRLEKQSIDQRMAELKALKAQINPHFLFNALNSIQAYILSDEKNVAEGYLVKYGKLMRKILDHSNELTVSLHEELEALQLYVELEQLRVKQGFDFEVILSADVDPYIVQIPSMVIQPFVENAIWHGVSSLDRKGTIQLHIAQKDDLVEVIIKDNGVGFDPNEEKSDEHLSRGVDLVKERLELLKASAGEVSVLEVNSVIGQGTEVILRFSADLL